MRQPPPPAARLACMCACEQSAPCGLLCAASVLCYEWCYAAAAAAFYTSLCKLLYALLCSLILYISYTHRERKQIRPAHAPHAFCCLYICKKLWIYISNLIKKKSLFLCVHYFSLVACENLLHFLSDVRRARYACIHSLCAPHAIVFSFRFGRFVMKALERSYVKICAYKKKITTRRKSICTLHLYASYVTMYILYASLSYHHHRDIFMCRNAPPCFCNIHKKKNNNNKLLRSSANIRATDLSSLFVFRLVHYIIFCLFGLYIWDYETTKTKYVCRVSTFVLQLDRRKLGEFNLMFVVLK